MVFKYWWKTFLIPNLYNCGKVCLSILGTWEGKESENWHPINSSLLQIYISIQSQILIDEPYYNEPGYEKNNDNGKKKSKEYNNDIRLYTMKHAILDLINNFTSYPNFEDIILEHFKF